MSAREAAQVVPLPRGRRRARFQASWHAFRRSSLGAAGVVVLGFLVGVALIALVWPLPYWSLTDVCATDQTNSSTYYGGLYLTGNESIDVESEGGGLSNGTYSFVVDPPPAYAATPSSGTFQVQGAPVTETIAFTYSPSTAVPVASPPSNGSFPAVSSPSSDTGGRYSVTFNATGLLDQLWSVTLDTPSPDLCRGGSPQICTFPQGSTPPHAGCYQTPTDYPSLIPPTFSTSPPSFGPLPLGSLTVLPAGNYFFSLYDALLRGSDWTLLWTFAAVGGAAVLGLAVGATGGFFGGAADEAVARFAEVFRSFPPFVFALVLMLTMDSVVAYNIPGGSNPSSGYPEGVVVAAFVVVLWPGFALSARSRARRVLAQPFVGYARACGAPRRWIYFRHVLPFCARPIVIQCFETAALVPLYLAGIAFLDAITITPYFPEWGTLTALSVATVPAFLTQCQISQCVFPWWQLLFPCMALALLVLSTLFVAEGLRAMPDPGLLPVVPGRPVRP